jgi:hypothetical protein
MAAQTTNLYLPEDLDDASKTRQLANSDLAALRTVADWINSFVIRPHKDLGAMGPCVPSCLRPWSGRLFGSLLNTSPAAACQMWSSS